MIDERLTRFLDDTRTSTLNRRQILKRAAGAGFAVPTLSLLLAACGDDDDDPTATTAPSQPDPAATSAPEDESTEEEEEETPEEVDDETPDAEPTATEEAEEEETEEEEDEPTATTDSGGAGGGIITIPVTTGDSGIGNPILPGRVIPIRTQVFSRLLYFDDLGSLQPDLAESWEFSSDSKELTLNLANATWHDGEPFDADDVIFTFDTIVDENTQSDLASRLQVAGETMTWEAVDSSTIRMTMVEPFAPMLFALSLIPIVPEHLLADSEDFNTDDFTRNPVGTGPFMIEEWVSDQFLRLIPFEQYHRGRPMSDGLTYVFLADSTAARAAFEAGEIDMFFTPPEAQAPFMDHPDYDLQRYVYFTTITLSFNHSHPILQDLTVRKAIEMAIDKDSLTESVTRGLGIVSHNQFAETGPLDRYNDYDNVPIPTYDPEEANRMLDEAGYAMGPDGIRTSPDGEPFSFPVLTYSGFDEYANAQVILQEMLAEIGIDLIPTVVEYTTLEGMWTDPNADPRERAMEVQEWPHPNEFDPDVFDELHSSNLPPGRNYGWFVDEEVDRLIEAGRTETDPDARVEIYRQLDVRRSETLPAIPLYLAVDAWVTNRQVLNRDGDPISSPYFRQYVVTDPWNWWKQT